jgi:hypothetical protein
MGASGQYGSALQTVVLDEYAALKQRDANCGLTDVSYSSALIEADDSGHYVGSEKLVSAWRRGTLQTMTLGALDVLLTHAGTYVGHLLDVICRRYGFRAVPMKAAKTEPLDRQLIRIPGEVGRLCDALHAAVEGGCTPDELHNAEVALAAMEARLVHARREVDALKVQQSPHAH